MSRNLCARDHITIKIENFFSPWSRYNEYEENTQKALARRS